MGGCLFSGGAAFIGTRRSSKDGEKGVRKILKGEATTGLCLIEYSELGKSPFRGSIGRKGSPRGVMWHPGERSFFFRVLLRRTQEIRGNLPKGGTPSMYSKVFFLSSGAKEER